MYDQKRLQADAQPDRRPRWAHMQCSRKCSAPAPMYFLNLSLFVGHLLLAPWDSVCSPSGVDLFNVFVLLLCTMPHKNVTIKMP